MCVCLPVAVEPTRLNAIQLSPTSILVTWEPPGSPVTGYKVFLEPDGHCVNAKGGDTDRQLVEDLQSGVEYSVSIVALSAHLPSTVAGPVTPGDSFTWPFCTSSYMLLSDHL